MSARTRGASAAAYPPEVLGSYAFIGDGERGCLVGPRGDVAWMCAPTWDSEAVFASLIGGPGLYAVTPASPFTWGGYYEPASLIWRSRWVTRAGVIECREALAFPGRPDRVVLLRQIASPEVPAGGRPGPGPPARLRPGPPPGGPPPRSDVDGHHRGALAPLAGARRSPPPHRRW